MKKHLLPTESLKDMLLRKLSSQTNEDGNFIYPVVDGQDVSEKERTGSNLRQLIEYTTSGGKEKNIDSDLFRDYLIDTMKIPMNVLYHK